jgi:coenzyme F420-0:L-glutamate ligase/coenzyme F420-1:gamma-L-glutamate ligase
LHGIDGAARDLVRPAQEDMFRTSPLQALHELHTARSFGTGDVPADALERAIAAASSVATPQYMGPWRFTVLRSDAARRAYLAATATRGEDEALGTAPVLILPWLSPMQLNPAQEPATAGRDALLLSAGASIQTLLLALSAHGLASSWIPPSIGSSNDARAALGIGDEWLALGTVACGPMAMDAPAPREAPEVSKIDLR